MYYIPYLIEKYYTLEDAIFEIVNNKESGRVERDSQLIEIFFNVEEPPEF